MSDGEWLNPSGDLLPKGSTSLKALKSILQSFLSVWEGGRKESATTQPTH